MHINPDSERFVHLVASRRARRIYLEVGDGLRRRGTRETALTGRWLGVVLHAFVHGLPGSTYLAATAPAADSAAADRTRAVRATRSQRSLARELWRYALRAATLSTIIAALAGPSPADASLGWSAPSRVDPLFSTISVSCPTASFCVALDGLGKAAIYNGSSWTKPTDINSESEGSLTSVSCTSATFCVAVDVAGNALTYNGSTWSARQRITGVFGGLSSVSCGSASFCAAVGFEGQAVSYNGSTWSAPASIDSGHRLRSVSCAAAFCAAVDSAGNALTYDGSKWSTPNSIDTGKEHLELVSVSCPSASFCAAIDNYGYALTYNGSSWTVPTLVSKFGSLASVSCVSASFCVAGATQDEFFTYNGSSWGAGTYVGSSGFSYGGEPHLACASASFCAAVDRVGDVFKYNGTSWSTPEVLGGGYDQLSCPSTSFCAAVDVNGRALTYNGSSWTAPAGIDGTSTLLSVSCPSESFCAAVDTEGNALTYNGSGWGKPKSIDSISGHGVSLTSVSCSSASFCVAVDLGLGSGRAQNTALVYNGTTWSEPLGIDSSGTFGDAVSCASATFCMAVDGNGNAVTYNGSKWSAPNKIDGTTELDAISCPTASFCVAVDHAGNALVYNGTWSKPQGIDTEGFGHSLSSVSCFSASFCVAVDFNGNSITYNGSTWSAPQGIGSFAYFGSSVSCPSVSLCLAMETAGNVVIYSERPIPPPPTIISPPTISGSTKQGQTLTEEHGSWTNSPTGYSYQWERCDSAGSNCKAIESATAQTYTLTGADAGSKIRVGETASNEGGASKPASSLATSVVEATSGGGGGETGGGSGGGSSSGGSGGTSGSSGGSSSGGVLAAKSAALPSPVVGQRQTAGPTSGTVLVRAKGASTFTPLSGPTSIPDGSEIDATNGRVTITAVGPHGETVTAEVYGGRFRVHQDASGETHFTLTLALTGCPRVGLPKGSAAALAFSAKRHGPKSRHLWVTETGGKWGTNGRFVSTSVEGTTWLTLDECTRSQVKVTAGKVHVRDLLRKKTVLIKAGKSYTATRH